MKISKVRSGGYKLMRVLGDVDAVLKGRIVQRAVRRYTGKWTARGLGKLFR